jgi:16S rRNA (guanine966-N2)-methyltransferase
MRVVAGSAGGRQLRAPAGGRARPTSERVREAVFAMLGSLGAVEGARVLDLFAGSGALGIEALSRGAAAATFVDDDPKAVAVVRANLAALGFEGAVVRSPVARFLEQAAASGAGWDVAFADPPYAFDGWPALLAALPARLAVLESDGPLDPGAGWEVVRSRRYGGTVVTLARQQ